MDGARVDLRASRRHLARSRRVVHKAFEPIAEHFDSFILEPRELYGEATRWSWWAAFKLRPKGVLETLDVPLRTCGGCATARP